MPFVDFSQSPERRTHLRDQYDAALKDWERVRGNTLEPVTQEEREAVDRLRDCSEQLRGKRSKHNDNHL